jgi:hypothetical protein
MQPSQVGLLASQPPAPTPRTSSPPRSNWDSECQKWLKWRVRTLPLCESSRDEAAASIAQFLSPRCPYQVCSAAAAA